MSHVERDAICLNLSFIWSLFSYSSYSVRGLLEAQNFTNCNSCNPKISIWFAALFIKINQHSKVSYSYKTGEAMHDWCYITFMITKTHMKNARKLTCDLVTQGKRLFAKKLN